MRYLHDLSPSTRAALGDRDVIVFDGVCVLCSGFFRFVLRHDRAERFHFVTAQSDLGQAMYRDLDLPTDDFETNLVITDGRIHERLDAFAAAMRALGGIWSVAGLVRGLPAWAKDPVYHLIARNRYRIFGRTETCLLPAPGVRARFLDLDRAA
ncbi:thiol-disulfide oxidoreductase DCC family protein [Jannaschia pohangensis]|uniref:Predicted thiol-disulfide oxidoreductase YuxK, DCC family n=1 Tax=Jannaschia pohangensis TaxID=390807 RepID=A0A1I3LQB3_9RHOB|nr:DCC1-like thiol-disulfide oxidoreductase family protein [Jannaschia pohangensis]SFI86873.1 Predicted thiol-disulfide oxidoreductase YuxK, DCC family [Jannaschia pohangensis]